VDFIQFSPQSFFHVGHTTSPDTAKSPCDIVSLDSKEKVQSPTDMAVSSAKKVKEKQTKAVIGTPTAQVPFYEFFQKQDDQKIHILIGATGSVATIKVPLIIAKLYKIFGPSKVSIQLVVTKCAEHFLKGLKISTEVKIWRDDEEWYGYKKTGDAILHQELRKWADIFLISPMSANTLAKMANGICDNLLTAIIRSWNPQYPMLIAPAMNTFMYTHPVTKKHLGFIKDECPWVEVLRPVEKVLVCGDIGMGGMREWSDIVEILVKKIKKMSDAKPYDPNSVDDGKDEEEEEDEDEDGEDGEDGEDDDDDDDEDEDEDDDDDDEDEDEDDALKTGGAPTPI
jgi:phosphopantothenoylcysteine decarboxylase